MECKLSDLNYGDKFRFNEHGFIHIIADSRGIQGIWDYGDFLYTVNISNGDMNKFSRYEDNIIVYKEV